MGVQRAWAFFRFERGDDSIDALASWQRGCEIGFDPACANARDQQARTAAPEVSDYPILVRGSKAPIDGLVTIKAVCTSVSTALARCLSTCVETAVGAIHGTEAR